MHRSLRLNTLLIALGLLAALPTQAVAAQLVVGFERGVDASERAAALQNLDAERIAGIPALRTVTVRVPDRAAARVEAALERRNGVRYAEQDVLMHANWTPNDPRLSSQWGIARIGAPAAWDITRASSSVVVAVVDSGVDPTHPDLAGRVVAGRDHVANDADPSDEHGHGTHVAGIAAASTDNGIGIAGTAPGATILSERVLDSTGSGYMSWIAAGIVHAADSGAQVINLSLSGSTGTRALRDAVLHARAKGAVVVCAAGNDGSSTLPYPAAYPECITVGATDSSDRRASFSNTGAEVDLVAPGVSILSTVRGASYASWNGTSMATPFVSGTAALLVAQGRDRDAVELALTSSARDLGAAGRDTTFGHGLLQASAAVATPGAAAPAPTTEPVGSEPAPTEPATSEPAPTEPAPTEPAPSEPAPTEPAPTEPAPTERTPTEPTPTEPAPTEPAPAPPAPVNVAPTCTSSSIVVAGATLVRLQCADAEGSPLALSVVQQPRKGRLGAIDQAAGTVTYTPKPKATGADSFTFRASDGQLWSAEAAVTVELRASAKARFRTTCVALRGGAKRCIRTRQVRTVRRGAVRTRWVRVATFVRR